MPQGCLRSANQTDRRGFIGGSDVRIIMGNDEAALHPAVEGKARRSGA